MDIGLNKDTADNASLIVKCICYLIPELIPFPLYIRPNDTILLQTP